MRKFLLFYVKKLGQPAFLKVLAFVILIAVLLSLFLCGIRRQFKLLERSADTELWYTDNSNISTYLQFSDQRSCKFCRNASNICNKMDTNGVVYFVMSHPRNAKRRHVIRASWGATDMAVRPIFVMGLSTEASDMILAVNEAHENKDVIIENFIDSLDNSTLKTASALKHFKHFCSEQKYLMKTEDDVFVNTNLVENIVRQRVSMFRGVDTPEIVGYIIQDGRVVRNARSSCYVGHSLFTEQKYPAYASGMGYLLSGHSVSKILAKSTHFPMIPIEDAFFTGIVASNSLERKMDTRFNWQPLLVKNHCIIRTRAIIYEPDPFKMYKLWRALIENNPTTCFNWFNTLIMRTFA